MSGKLITRSGGRAAVTVAVAAAWAWGWGCEAPFAKIDRRTEDLLTETNRSVGADTVEPRLDWEPGSKPPEYGGESIYANEPPTDNPSADELVYPPEEDAENVIARLDSYAEPAPDALEMDLTDALTYSVRNAREYRFAEESYVLEVLRLLSERHLWGPRVFNDTELAVDAFGDSGLYDTSLRLVNDLRVTQRLPYGGNVSAQFLAAATWDLHEAVAGENVQTADLIFAADLPLLRGAGMVAREDLIQSERNVIYAARVFERFRREFLVDITTDFLDLVIQQEAIKNTEANVELLGTFEQRAVALVEAGRTDLFQAAEAAQSTLFRRDSLAAQREAYRLALDRFKVRLGMPDEQPLRIVPSSPGLPVPDVDMEQAVRAAMSYRLDLQNRRDFIADFKRGVNNARNDLLADLDLAGSIEIPTDDTKDYPGLDFDLESTTFRAALVLGLPIDRTIERLVLRDTQIQLERSIREYDRFRDDVAVEVRSAVRNIDRALFSRDLQEENLRIADLRIKSIEAAPDRASSTDRNLAATGLLGAQDDYLVARRDLQVAILRFLLDSGQLRVEPDGTIRPLRGMELREGEPLDYGGTVDPAGATQ